MINIEFDKDILKAAMALAKEHHEHAMANAAVKPVQAHDDALLLQRTIHYYLGGLLRHHDLVWFDENGDDYQAKATARLDYLKSLVADNSEQDAG